jgi:hypothetical protein
MVDPSSISASVDLAKGGWELLEYLRKVAGADVVSAYFRYDGTRIEGSSKIEIELHPLEAIPLCGGTQLSRLRITYS